MNKKLKLYTTLLVVLIAFSAVSSFFAIHTHNSSAYTSVDTLYFDTDYSDFVESRDTLEDSAVFTNWKPCYSFVFDVQPKGSGCPLLCSTVYSDDAVGYRSSFKKIEMKKIQLTMPYDKIPSAIKSVALYGFLPSIIVSIAVYGIILFIVIRLIRRIRRGEVFTELLSRDLEKAGKLMILSYLFGVVISYLLFLFIESHISIAYYDIVFRNESNIFELIMGFVLMILSQIILMGKDIKDEQDLTI